jgi:hypothetical protein
MMHSACLLLVCTVALAAAPAPKAPEVGYAFPAAVPAGAATEGRLGGYDWTPDVQFFTSDPRVTIESLGPPGPPIVPEPPYWFGAKAMGPGWMIPREMPARITVAADVPAGPVRWRVANANGASNQGVLWIGAAGAAVEVERRRAPQELPPLPTAVSGRVRKIAEVDTYRFDVPQAGPVTLRLLARRLGSNFNAVVEVRDPAGRLVADAADTAGNDLELQFDAQAGAHEVRVFDVDFRGNEAFTYRLEIAPGAMPAIAWPPADVPALAEPADTAAAARTLSDNVAVDGALAAAGEADDYWLAAKAGQSWSIAAEARRHGSPLDTALTVFGADEKPLATADDVPGTTDASLVFAAPADGTFRVRVADNAGRSGAADARYRLVVRQVVPDFALRAPDLLDATLGAAAELTVAVQRSGGFTGPIALAITGLPAGITVPADLTVPEGANDLKVPFTVAADAPVAAFPVTIAGTATVAEQSVTHPLLATGTGSLCPRSPDELLSASMLLAVRMLPRASVEAVDKDGGRTVHRGTTFPADVIVHRYEGFDGPVLLTMAARQTYHQQGIRGFDKLIPPGVTRTFFPCFMPEWLETSRTSRMMVVAECQAPDPQGRVRHLVTGIDGRITMSLEGALMKLSQLAGELTVVPGAGFDIPVRLTRSPKLPLEAVVTLIVPEELSGLLVAEPVTLPPGQVEAMIRITTAADPRLAGQQSFTLRATALPSPELPVVSEAGVTAMFAAPDAVTAAP